MSLNNKGTSLMSVIIAASVLGAIMFAANAFLLNTLKMQKHTENVSELSVFMDEVKILLGNTTRCTTYLHDQLINDDLQIKDISQGIDISKNTIKFGWNIQSIKIDNETLLPDGNKLAKLTFKVNKVHQNAGPQMLARQITLEYKPKINLGSEAIDTCSLIGNIDIDSTVGKLTFPDSTCSTEEYAVGFSNGNVICSTIPANAVKPAASTAVPGKGCTGAFCVASDFGPCDGAFCKTNGTFCNGVRCNASGVGATCEGTYCTVRKQ